MAQSNWCNQGTKKHPILLVPSNEDYRSTSEFLQIFFYLQWPPCSRKIFFSEPKVCKRNNTGGRYLLRTTHRICFTGCQVKSTRACQKAVVCRKHSSCLHTVPWQLAPYRFSLSRQCINYCLKSNFGLLDSLEYEIISSETRMSDCFE